MCIMRGRDRLEIEIFGKFLESLETATFGEKQPDLTSRARLLRTPAYEWVWPIFWVFWPRLQGARYPAGPQSAIFGKFLVNFCEVSCGSYLDCS